MGFVWYLITGVSGGLLGGMGMGGGTVLIPLLTLILGVGQHVAQSVNLVSFIPMAVTALIIHLKNDLIDFSNVVYVIIAGVISCIIGCYVAKNIDGFLLKKLFGAFLVCLSVWQIVSFIRTKKV